MCIPALHLHLFGVRFFARPLVCARTLHPPGDLAGSGLERPLHPQQRRVRPGERKGAPGALSRVSILLLYCRGVGRLVAVVANALVVAVAAAARRVPYRLLLRRR